MINYIIINYLDIAHLDCCFKQFSSNGNYTVYLYVFIILIKLSSVGIYTSLIISDPIRISFYL